MSDTITFSILYTLLVLITSGYYYHRGKVNGIKDVLSSLREEEPVLSRLFIKKIEQKLNMDEVE
jgi:hypothetical protein